MIIAITALTSARDDEGGVESPSQVGRSGKMTLPSHVISSGGSMLYDSTVKTATVSMSREIPLINGVDDLARNRLQTARQIQWRSH